MSERTTMNGKPVINVVAKTVINMNSGFKDKLLCDGPTFSAGTACAYSCAFCYVPDIMQKSTHMAGIDAKHEDVVVRRVGAATLAANQLRGIKGNPKFKDKLDDQRVIYGSPLVDVAANMDLVRETFDICREILTLTNWQIRLLSKSNLLPKLAEMLGSADNAKARVIYGVSTGTLDDGIAACIEQGTPKVSMRVKSLHWLQDNGYRTFGMICPSVPVFDYNKFAYEAHAAIRSEKCEHVWAEVINARGESFTRTVTALRDGGFDTTADALEKVCADKSAWEQWSRETFLAHARACPANKLRFLQYVDKSNIDWWASEKNHGAVLLGKLAEKQL